MLEGSNPEISSPAVVASAELCAMPHPGPPQGGSVDTAAASPWAPHGVLVQPHSFPSPFPIYPLAVTDLFSISMMLSFKNVV